MTALIIIGVILLLLFLLAITRFGVWLKYEDKVLCIKAIAGFIKLTVYPLENAEKNAKKKRKKEEKKKLKEASKKTEETEPVKKAKPDPIMMIKQGISPAMETIGRLRRKLQINKLTIRFIAAADNPFSAVMAFGVANGTVGMLLPLIENAFKVKDKDITTDVTFESEENIIYVDAQLTLALWEIIYIGFAMLPVKNILEQQEPGKVENDGQASDK